MQERANSDTEVDSLQRRPLLCEDDPEALFKNFLDKNREVKIFQQELFIDEKNTIPRRTHVFLTDKTALLDAINAHMHVHKDGSRVILNDVAELESALKDIDAYYPEVPAFTRADSVVIPGGQIHVEQGARRLFSMVHEVLPKRLCQQFKMSDYVRYGAIIYRIGDLNYRLAESPLVQHYTDLVGKGSTGSGLDSTPLQLLNEFKDTIPALIKPLLIQDILKQCFATIKFVISRTDKMLVDDDFNESDIDRLDLEFRAFFNTNSSRSLSLLLEQMKVKVLDKELFVSMFNVLRQAIGLYEAGFGKNSILRNAIQQLIITMVDIATQAAKQNHDGTVFNDISTVLVAAKTAITDPVSVKNIDDLKDASRRCYQNQRHSVCTKRKINTATMCVIGALLLIAAAAIIVATHGLAAPFVAAGLAKVFMGLTVTGGVIGFGLFASAPLAKQHAELDDQNKPHKLIRIAGEKFADELPKLVRAH